MSVYSGNSTKTKARADLIDRQFSSSTPFPTLDFRDPSSIQALDVQYFSTERILLG